MSYSNNQDFNFSAFDQNSRPSYVEQMDVSPQHPSAPPVYGTPPMNSRGPQQRQNPPPPGFFPPNPGNQGFQNQYVQNDQYVFDPMVANFAMQYGSKLVGSGKDMVDQKIGKYVALNALRYYFSVDTRYVLKKLCLLLFPFTNKDWGKITQDEPLPPRLDVNAPDLYIPLMAYVTYVLVTGVLLGVQDKFSPEVLGVISSQALAWVILELLIQSVTLYVTNINTRLKLLDLLAFIGYKFLMVIICIFLGLLLYKSGYYIGLAYCSVSLGFFIMRALKHHIIYYPEEFQENDYSAPSLQYNNGTKRRLYFLLFAGISQPVLIWFLSKHILEFLP